MDYIKSRLAEHSTQLALSADFTALLGAVSGTSTWQTFLMAVVGTLPAVLFPSK